MCRYVPMCCPDPEDAVTGGVVIDLEPLQFIPGHRLPGRIEHDKIEQVWWRLLTIFDLLD